MNIKNSEFIDVTLLINEIQNEDIAKYADGKISPVLVFLPNLNYAGMTTAEKLASDMNIGFLCIPITLAMIDIIKQLEYSGVHATEDMIFDLENHIRSAIITALDSEANRREANQ